MSDQAAAAQAPESPNYFSVPGRGKGVRRLNRVPLLIVGALVALAAAAIAYTFIQRQEAMRIAAAAPAEADNVSTPATPPVRPEPFAAPPQPPSAPSPTQAAAASSSVPADTEARLQLIRRLAEKKLTTEEAALGADTDIPALKRASSADASPANDTPAAMALSPAQLAASALGAVSPAGALGPGAQSALAALGGQQGDANQQEHKRAFLARSPEAQTYLAHTRTAALSDLEVKAGTVIPGVMVGGVNSDLPGQIIGQVRENVYDTATGEHVLIPAAARLVGSYDSTVTMGQRRVLVAWSRLIYPDGSSVSLDLMPGADPSGYGGFADEVNNHYWRIFGNALLLSVFSAGLQLSQPQPNSTSNGYDSQQIMAAELGRQLGQLGSEMTRRNLDIQPTLEIRPGYRFNVMVTKDIVLPRWEGHPLATDG